MRTGITLAMIARNEERCLARCLSSVKDHVESIVVVDTGSTDRTPEIARSFGARVEAIEWPGAFDEARNASLALVETEWVLWLDADEWFVEGHASQLAVAIRREDAFGYLLVRRDLFPSGGFGEQVLLRLWRHDPSLRFVGVIHEHLDPDALEQATSRRKVFESRIAFFHDGFRPEPSEEKLARNVPLLRKELELRPGQIYYEIELANSLERMGDPEGLVWRERLLNKLLAMADLDDPPDNTVSLFFCNYLAGLADSDLRSAEADAVIRLARGWFALHPTVLSLVAQTEIRRGNLVGAYAALRDVEQLAESGAYDRTTSTNPILLGEGLYLNLGIVAHQLGKLDVAKRSYRKLLQIHPDHPVAEQNLRLLGS